MLTPRIVESWILGMIRGTPRHEALDAAQAAEARNPGKATGVIIHIENEAFKITVKRVK